MPTHLNPEPNDIMERMTGTESKKVLNERDSLNMRKSCLPREKQEEESREIRRRLFKGPRTPEKQGPKQGTEIGEMRRGKQAKTIPAGMKKVRDVKKAY